MGRRGRRDNTSDDHKNFSLLFNFEDCVHSCKRFHMAHVLTTGNDDTAHDDGALDEVSHRNICQNSIIRLLQLVVLKKIFLHHTF